MDGTKNARSITSFGQLRKYELATRIASDMKLRSTKSCMISFLPKVSHQEPAKKAVTTESSDPATFV